MILTVAHLARPIRNTQTLHALVAAATHGDTHRTLWANPASRVLVIQSTAKPVLGRETDRCTHANVTTPPAGTHVTVSLIANPVKAAFTRGVRGIRTPLQPDQWDDWLTRKLGPAIRLDHIQSQPAGVRVGVRQGDIVTHTRAAFTATGTVRDQRALETLQLAGVGPAKAYGCGLLLVKATTP